MTSRSATNLWLIPAESVAAVLLFAVTLSVDRAAFHHEITLDRRHVRAAPVVTIALALTEIDLGVLMRSPPRTTR